MMLGRAVPARGMAQVGLVPCCWRFQMIRRVLFAVTLVLAHSPAWAAEFKTGNVIIDPAIRATPGGAKVGAGYLTIRNTGSAPTV
jgi:copper(I)-binding protein